ncbi:MAG: VWA domain-containing protein [Gemmataceae bacterium]|nr:VWA domain-containing protein [Gemmataceae bacterium]
MRNDLTDITVVMDRSGSMHACQTDAEGGLNRYIDEQKRQPGEALFSLVQFDTEYEFVHRGVPIRNVPHCSLVPRGNTALLDALGRAIVETGERLAKLPEADRPGLVVMVVLTDGQENSSKEFSRAKVKEMIEHQQSVYKWQFIYLGANQDSFAEAGGLGMTGSVGTWTAATQAVAYAAASANTARMREQVRFCKPVANAFTTEELDEMSGK